MRWSCWLLLLAAFTTGASAHEVRPASLQITESVNGSVLVRWRQPVTGDYTIAISPVLSSGWLDGEPQQREVTRDSLIKLWIVAAPHTPLVNQTLWISGLDRTITDTLVEITYADGTVLTRLLKAARPVMQIPAGKQPGVAVPEYLLFGVSHIWSGLDHLLYVLGLLLLISGLRTLVTTITAFTVAHSLTLACAALGLIRLRPAPVEAVIALSIIYVALELQRQSHGLRPASPPWLMAFSFGLLHGFGFAGALRQIGLPEHSVPGALLLFNVGIEIGQLLFVALVLTMVRVLRDYLPNARRRVVRLAPYGIGTLASYWLIQRIAAFV